MTTGQAARLARNAAVNLDAAVRQGLDTGGRQALREAIRISSGNIPTRTLATPLSRGGLAHPYGLGTIGSLGRRGAVPYGSTAIVNAQSGAFRSAWRGDVRGFRFDVINSDEKAARILRGGQNVVARPYDVPISAVGARAIPNAVRRNVLALYSPFTS